MFSNQSIFKSKIRIFVFIVLLISSFRSVAQNHFYVIFSSDPQYPWSESAEEEDKKKEESKVRISSQYRSMTKIANDMEKSIPRIDVKSVIINGDLTAFGHGWQLDEYKDLLAKNLYIPFYLGLGNHDYANNVNDCVNNGCASQMVDYMYGLIKDMKYVNYDYSESSYYKFPELRTDYTGSLSYSFNIGKIHFVQLQNYPTYATTWNRWNTEKARRDFYSITSSMQWLKNDLAIARNNGNIIIVNMHDYGDHFSNNPEFVNIITTYGVSAVFSGHIHSDCGFVGNIATIPHFRSGSSTYLDYLLVKFDTESNRMFIEKIVNDKAGNDSLTQTIGDYSLNANVPVPPLPVPSKDSYVTFFNEGGFVAQFELYYTKANGDSICEKTGDMALGNKKTYTIPGDATKIRIFAKECTGLAWAWWKTVFDINLPEPPNKCYKLYGTTLSPGWNNDCE